ncbi:alanine dehydrogenase [Magnetovibrio blakemorei]|uniref:Alanine dehydrogenase n=1 Tax=Magnetovibrio blakemorei TaxID=28181 RepID=A0A1E5Q6H2_9PROT|nr:alanine dehydrogenase [Magnetovibrio blakemorei]OEJ66292.1 alanine dehydrogenase [Magnetovibrio blakemorei]
MRIGIPKEIKNGEFRVGMTPASVREAAQHGHSILVETGAGIGIGATDQDYENAGATIAPDAALVWERADLVVKVKEPQAVERARLRAGQTLFTYLHLAPDTAQTSDLMRSGAICIAYETVTSNAGELPLLHPMSEVAGRMSIQVAAHALEREAGGRGVLLGGVPGVAPAKVTIIGGGTVGANAALMAIGTGAEVVVLDRSNATLRSLNARFGARVKTIYSNSDTLEDHVLSADVVVGGVLIPGASAPKLVSEAMIKAMRPGSVVVDVAIDQGGCFETSHGTTHAAPTYVVHDVVHYAVTNMPGAVPHTSTYALNNATLPFILALADKGAQQALSDDRHLLNGLNVWAGKITCRAVAEAQGLDFTEPKSVL